MRGSRSQSTGSPPRSQTDQAERRAFSFGIHASRNDLHDRLTMIDLKPLPSRHLQAVRIQSKLVEHRGMKIGHVMRILDGMETNFVGGAVCDATLDPAARQEAAEGVRMMI